ncbi:hypothetical protein [Actinoalloteichus spitiensis]|uniref:hypothetical protein n=1 Tax=Actinoalloteichus spitiensis TaxID=252394 RepID=UPI0012F68781|nr:hypothetical protein [Actinoalloteichus spitiensis]
MATTHHPALRALLGALVSAAALLDHPVLPTPGPAPVDDSAPTAVASPHPRGGAGENAAKPGGREDTARRTPDREECRTDSTGRRPGHPGSCPGHRPTPIPPTSGPLSLADGPRTPWRLCGEGHHGRYAFSPAGELLRCAPTVAAHDAPDDEWRWQPVPARS